MKRRTRHVAAGASGLLALLLVTACTDSSAGGETSPTNGSRTTVTMTEVEGTDALRPRTALIGSWDTVVQGDRGTVVTEITGSDGNPAQLYAVDPTKGDRTALDVSAPLGWGTAVNDSVAVIAGDRSDDGSAAPFVRLSKDLTTWEKVPLAYPEPGWRYAGVGLDGDVPLVVAAKPDGSKVLLRIDGEETTAHALPAADGTEIGVVDIVEHRGELVLVHTEAARGDEPVTAIMTSSDGGRTWSRHGTLQGKRGTYGAAGAISIGDHLVVTGWADRDQMRGSTGVAWTSTDARTWTRKRITPLSLGQQVLIPGPDYHLTAPTLVDGKAVFDQTCDMCTWTTRAVHTGEKYQLVKNERDIDGVSPTSDQLPGSLTSGVRLEQGSLVAFGPQGSRTIVEGDRGRRLQSIESVGSTAYVSAGQSVFVREGKDAWHTTTEVTPFVLDKNLEQREWDPSPLNQWSGLSSATNPQSGTTVAVGTTYSEKDGFRSASQSLRQGTWTKATGLGRHPYESAGDVTHAGGDFLMDLVVAQNASTAVRTARIYSSADGTKWTQEKGTWSRSDTGGSRIHDVCSLPDGTALAVGTSQADRNSPWEATTWTRGKKGWDLDVPKVEGRGAEFHSCATSGDVTVVSGSVAGDDIEWTTREGTGFTPGEALPRGVSRGGAHEVEGGLVAAGYISTADHLGPVVWHSTDGTTWQWAPIDVTDASASAWIDTVEDEVYVVTSQSSGDRLWRIDEIAETAVTADEA